MDDLLTVAHNLSLGSRLKDGQLQVTQETHDLDKEANMSCEEVTIDILREVANDIIPFLKFTSEDSPGATNSLPCLDSQKTKVATFSSKVIRRMKTISTYLSQESTEAILMTLM